MFSDTNGNLNGMNQNFFGEDINVDVDFTMNQPNYSNNMEMMGNMSQPIIEPMQERVVNRTIMHEVPHVCPINTRIINNHVYRHTYSPRYTCCEENTCTNVQCGSCCCFNNR